MTSYKKLLCFLPAFLSLSLGAQFHTYPKNQTSYIGGDAQFYKEFHQILVDKNLKPCENKKELYQLKVIVAEDGSVKNLKDEQNSEMAVESKCAYDLSREVLKYLNNWQPPKINGVKKQAIASFYIFPDDLFERYTEGYNLENDITGGLPGGINQFRTEVSKKINLDGFNWEKPFQLAVIFIINKEGKMEDVRLEESSGNPDFDRRIINGVKSVKKKWNPATINGVPIKFRFRLPLSFGS